MAKIFLSVPILGKPELKMMYSMYQAILAVAGRHQVRVYFNENDSLISRVRNVHMSIFYNTYPECDYFMSLDSDLELDNTPGNNLFAKLVEANKDFVGGLYAIKKPGVRRSSSMALDGSVPRFNEGLKEMRWLSSGCWCVKREVVTKMIEKYPELTYDGDDNATGKKIYGLYIPMLYDLKYSDCKNFANIQLPFRKYLSEDWSFCERWTAIGGQIYADTSILLRHIGKVDYTLWSAEEMQKTQLPPPGFDLGKGFPNV